MDESTLRKQSDQATNIIRESRLRSVLKAVSWRVLATLTTMVIAYFVTGNVGDALKIGSVEVGVKLVIFYLHERTWAQLSLGAVRKMLPSGSK